MEQNRLRGTRVGQSPGAMCLGGPPREAVSKHESVVKLNHANLRKGQAVDTDVWVSVP